MIDLKMKTRKKVESTTFSEFFRGASSGEQKKVFARVITTSTQEQRKVIEEAERLLKA